MIFRIEPPISFTVFPQNDRQPVFKNFTHTSKEPFLFQPGFKVRMKAYKNNDKAKNYVILFRLGEDFCECLMIEKSSRSSV